MGTLLIASCGSSDDTAENSKAEFNPSSYDLPEIEKIIKSGDSLKAIQILKTRSQLGMSNSDELMKLAELYLQVSQGVAAAVIVEQARDIGVSRTKSALLMAKAHMLNNDLGKAERELTLVSLTGDKGFEAILLKGDIASKRESYDEARNLFSMAASMKPESNLPDKALAFMELKTGNIEQAEKFANSAYTKKTGDLSAKYILGTVKRNLGDNEGAEEILRSIVDEESKHYTALIELAGIHLDNGEYEEVEKLLDIILPAIPNNTMALFYSASLAVEAERYEEAEKILLRLDGLRNTYIPARRLYAYVLYKEGKHEVASPLLRNILEIIPDDRALRLAFADSLIATNKNQEAIDVLQYLLEQNDVDTIVNMQSAVAFSKMGNNKAAAQYFLKVANNIVLETDGDKRLYRDMIENAAIVEALAGNSDKAISLLKQLSTTDFVESKQLLVLANMQMEAGANTQAIETLNILKIKDPENIVIYNLEGSIEHRLGNYEKAIELFSHAILTNPQYFSAIKNRASSRMALKMFNEANQDLKQLANQASGDPDVHGMLGETYLELGNYKEAVRALSRATEMSPQAARLSFLLARSFAGNKQFTEAVKQAKATLVMVKGNKEAEVYLHDLITEYQDRSEIPE